MSNPDHFAIVIGIGRYPQFRRLNGAVSDAERFLLWLRDSAGLKPENIAYALSPPDAVEVDAYNGPPGEGHIRQALERIQLRAAIQNPGFLIGKRLYFFFSGHGFGPTADDVGLLLPVSDAESLQPSLSLRLYRDFFQLGMFFEEVIWFLDCCRDFKPGHRGNGPPLILPENKNIRSTKEFVVMASAWGAAAFEDTPGDDKDRRGILSSALLDGLSGAVGAFDFQGRITTTSLRKYLDRSS
jgi:hypothetical protein